MNGKLTSIESTVTKSFTSIDFSIDYFYYKGYCGDGQHDGKVNTYL